jgi:hypothetical protein
MSDPSCSIGSLREPQQAIREDLQLRESEAVEQANRDARRQRLTEILAAGYRDLTSFVGDLLAPMVHPRGNTFFADLARSLLAFNETLIEADREYPR